MKHLEEGFDPKTLKVAELRKILNLHEIPYSASDKKSVLLKSFNENIIPKRNELLKKYNDKSKIISDEGFINADESESQDRSHVSSNNDDIILDSEDDADNELTRDSIKTFTNSGDETKHLSNRNQTKPLKSNKTNKVKSSTIIPNNEKQAVYDKSLKSDDDIKSEDKSTSFSNENVFQSASLSNKKRKHEDEIGSDKELKVKKVSKKLNIPKVKAESKKQESLVESPTLQPNKSFEKKIITKNDTSDNLFNSLEEETAHFDSELKKINEKKVKDSLGITIQGFQPPNISSSSTPKKSIKQELKSTDKKEKSQSPNEIKPLKTRNRPQSTTPSKIKSSSKKSTPKKSPIIIKSALTPKPRLISISSQNDQEDEENDNTVDDSIIQIVQEKSNKKQISKSKLSINLIITFLVWIMVVIVGLFAYWFQDQQYLVGYCGQEIDQVSFGESSNLLLKQLGQVLDSYCKPKCVQCPSNARCFPNFKLGCFEDYVEFQPWYEFIVPGSKRCIPDTKKAEKINIMIDVALDLLRSKNANIQCGKGLIDEDSGISEKDLYDILLSMKAPYITTEEFEEIFKKCLEILVKEEDIKVTSKNLQLYSPMKLQLTTRRQKHKRRTKFFDQRPYQTLV